MVSARRATAARLSPQELRSVLIDCFSRFSPDPNFYLYCFSFCAQIQIEQPLEGKLKVVLVLNTSRCALSPLWSRVRAYPTPRTSVSNRTNFVLFVFYQVTQGNVTRNLR